MGFRGRFGFAVRLRYLNLCSEEYYLKKRWLLSGRVWRIWEAEMRRALGSQPYRDAWPTPRAQFASYPESSELVAGCQAVKQTVCRRPAAVVAA